MTSKLSLETSASFGWGSPKFNETYLSISKGAANVLAAGLSLNYSPTAFLYFRPHFQVSAILDGALRGRTASATNVCGGMAVGLTF